MGSSVVQLLGAVPGSANTYGFGIKMVNAADLSMHGGEDCVVTRVIGKLCFFQQETAALGSVPTFSRVLLTMEDVQGAPGAEAQQVREWITGDALGRDDILFTETCYVDGANLFAGGASEIHDPWRWVNFNVKVKRKVQADRMLFLQYQCVTALVPTQLSMAGHLRILLMRPR